MADNLRNPHRSADWRFFHEAELPHQSPNRQAGRKSDGRTASSVGSARVYVDKRNYGKVESGSLHRGPDQQERSQLSPTELAHRQIGALALGRYPPLAEF